MLIDLWTALKEQIKSVEDQASDMAPQVITQLMVTLTIRQIARRCKRPPLHLRNVLEGKTYCDIHLYNKLEEMLIRENLKADIHEETIW